MPSKGLFGLEEKRQSKSRGTARKIIQTQHGKWQALYMLDGNREEKKQERGIKAGQCLDKENIVI